MNVTRKAFRELFEMTSKEVAHYFPMHMARGMDKMQRKLKDVDLVLEMHDARIPLTGRNNLFSDTLFLRPHLLVMNKMDIADLSYKEQVTAKLKQQGVENILYTDCKAQRHKSITKKIIPKIMEILKNAPRYHREQEDHYSILVVGLPNVGKSSLINSLRRNFAKKGKATRVGGLAGITTSVLNSIRVCNNPRMYVYDTPGIMLPDIPDMEVGMKLALCATIRDHIMGEDMIADYLLYWMNKHKIDSYVSRYNLPSTTDNIYEMLSHICKENKLVLKKRSPAGGYMYVPDFARAAHYVLTDFRNGDLGYFNLDRDLLEKSSSNT